MRAIVLAMALLSSCAAGRIVTPQGATVQGVAFGCACLGWCDVSCRDPNAPDPNGPTVRIQGGTLSGRGGSVLSSVLGLIGAAVAPLAL